MAHGGFIFLGGLAGRVMSSDGFGFTFTSGNTVPSSWRCVRLGLRTMINTVIGIEWPMSGHSVGHYGLVRQWVLMSSSAGVVFFFDTGASSSSGCRGSPLVVLSVRSVDSTFVSVELLMGILWVGLPCKSSGAVLCLSRCVRFSFGRERLWEGVFPLRC